MSHWLITWEWIGNHAETGEKIASILNYRLGGETVRQITERLYVNSTCSPGERLAYANNKRNNPYPAEFELVKGAHWQGRIMCGQNPCLYARLVDDLHVESDENGEERLIWSERQKPDFDKLED